jgi:hypothetical protein
LERVYLEEIKGKGIELLDVEESILNEVEMKNIETGIKG